MPHNHPTNSDSLQTTGRLWASLGLNTGIVIVELVGGLISGSLALISDGIHNLSDTSSLIISLAARKIAGKRANKSKTFGYRRAEIIGAFINLIVLIVISIILIRAAVERFIHPGAVDGEWMIIVGIIAAVGNFGVVFLLAASSKGSLNIKSTYLHFLADGLASIGVFIGGLLIIFYHFYIVDPILTLLIAGYIIWQSIGMLRETIDILMEGTPHNLDVNTIIRNMRRIEGVRDIHHVHVWQMDENNILLESHVMINRDDARHIELIKDELKTMLRRNFDIHHSTLEFEWKPCRETVIIPHH
jgi:cobalt-zinc-cadmium efflux system protein